MKIQKRSPRAKLLSLAAMLLCMAAMFAIITCAPGPVRTTGKFTKKQCLDCHTDFKGKYFGMKSVHAVVKDQKCEDCHLRHGVLPKLLLKAQGNQLCLTCHKTDQIGMAKNKVHSALKNGQCIDCHNPHASEQSQLLKAAGDDLCFRCHQSDQFNKTVVHPALKEKTCLRCHFSHSSDQPNLLKNESIALCRSCHDLGAGAFRQAHDNYPVDRAECTGCHNPHASLQPRLMKASVHAPVVKDDCNACHTPAESEQNFTTPTKGRDLCLKCHKAEDLMAGGALEHPPFQKGRCKECHLPHASENERLLVRPGNNLCLGCHADRQTKRSIPHKALTEGKGCLACHVRHASAKPKMLPAGEQEVCLKCHTRILLEKKTLKPHTPFMEGSCGKCHSR